MSSARATTRGMATRKYFGRSTNTTTSIGTAINSQRGSRITCGHAIHHTASSSPMRQHAALLSIATAEVGGKKKNPAAPTRSTSDRIPIR